MSKGVEFHYMARVPVGDGRYRAVIAAPPYVNVRDQIFGKFTQNSITSTVLAAVMWDYYSVGAEEQRRMAENTIAMCEMLYSQQEIAND